VWNYLAQISKEDPKMAKALFDVSFKEIDMCPGRDHMNGPQLHAYDNGFCLYCKRPKELSDD
jgi:hypothetical protein